MNKTATIVVLSLLTGCATPYVEPTGSVVTLAIHNNAASNVTVQAFKVAEDCSGGKLKLTDGSKLAAGQSVDIKVKADEGFSFYAHYTSGNKYCLMPGTFTPKEGERYVARFMATQDKCYLGVLVVTPSGEKREPSFRLRDWRAPFFESGSFCK